MTDASGTTAYTYDNANQPSTVTTGIIRVGPGMALPQ